MLAASPSRVKRGRTGCGVEMILVGTSGWQYRDWRELPPNLRADPVALDATLRLFPARRSSTPSPSPSPGWPGSPVAG